MAARKRVARILGTWMILGLVASAGTAVAEESWPGLRGPSYTGGVEDRLFGGEGAALEVAWKKALGFGYSSVVVGDGRVLTLFASGDSDVLASFDTETGEELWRYRVGDTYAGHDGSHDGPIATPLLAGGRVFGLGPRGKLFAVAAGTGEELWAVDLVEAHGAVKPYYGFGTSPALADGVLAVQIGAGDGKSIAGFDPSTGGVLWSLGDGEIDFQSPVVAVLAGQSQLLASTQKTLFGIEPASGELLWSWDHEGDQRAMGGATIIPVPAGEDRVLLLNRIDSSVMLQVSKGDDGWAVSELWSNGAIRGTYVIPVYHDGYLYGMSGRIFTCVEAATGETVWRSRDPGDGFPTLVGDKLVIVTKPGTLHVAAASPEGYTELASLDLFDEHSWSSVAYSGGHLFARSMGALARIDPSTAGLGAAEDGSWLAATGFGAFLEQVATAEDKAFAVDAFLAAQESLPVVEPSGAVHFLFRGGEAEDVGIVGDMIGSRREEPMKRVPGTDLFYYSTRLEPDAAVTYGFLVDYGSTQPDPANPVMVEGIFGETSWLAMPAWEGPEHDPEAPRRGRLETIEWQSEIREGATRIAEVYLPAAYESEPERRFPAVYVHDGKSALHDGEIPLALEHHLGRDVEPLIAIFIFQDEESRADRTDPEGYSRLVATELVPLIDERFRTRADRLARASAGGGRGANVALYTAFKQPETFGRAAAQGLMMMTGEEYSEDIPDPDRHPMVLYQEWGTYHVRAPHEAWDMVEANRKLWRILRERGFRPAGGEVPEGFGWACWKARTDDWLEALFPMSREAGKGLGAR